MMIIDNIAKDDTPLSWKFTLLCIKQQPNGTPVLSSTDIFVAINNTLYGSKLYIFIL